VILRRLRRTDEIRPLRKLSKRRGWALAATGEPPRLAQQLVGVAEGFFVSLCFVMLGAQLQFAALLESPRALALFGGLVLAAVVVHMLVALILRRPVALGLLATAALGVPSAVVAIGLRQGILDAGQAAAIVIAVLATIAPRPSVGCCWGGGWPLRRRSERADRTRHHDRAVIKTCSPTVNGYSRES
jgi:Kef-type K+ transport system membrane component KefB